MNGHEAKRVLKALDELVLLITIASGMTAIAVLFYYAGKHMYDQTTTWMIHDLENSFLLKTSIATAVIGTIYLLYARLIKSQRGIK